MEFIYRPYGNVAILIKKGMICLQQLGVGIMYLIMGCGTYLFAERLQLRTTPLSLRIGKYLYYAGWVITIGAVIGFIPDVPKNFSLFVMSFTVLAVTVVLLRAVEKFRARLEYDERFFKRIVTEQSKREFDVVLRKFPDIVFKKDIIELIATRGLLELWMANGIKKMTKEEEQLYRSYLLLDAMNQQ